MAQNGGIPVGWLLLGTVGIGAVAIYLNSQSLAAKQRALAASNAARIASVGPGSAVSVAPASVPAALAQVPSNAEIILRVVQATPEAVTGETVAWGVDYGYGSLTQFPFDPPLGVAVTVPRGAIRRVL